MTCVGLIKMHIHIVRLTKVQIKHPRFASNWNVRTSCERPIGTFKDVPLECPVLCNTVRLMSLQIQRNVNLIRTYILDIYKTSRYVRMPTGNPL